MWTHGVVMQNDAKQDTGDERMIIPISLGNISLCVDSFGGKVRRIVPEDIQRNILFEPDTPFTLEGVRIHRFEVTGWDEACPSVAESSGIPQLGWAWQTQSEMQQRPDSFCTTWRLPGMTVERTLAAEKNILTSSYQFHNVRSEPVPFLWASHALYPVDKLLNIVMPEGQLIPGPGCLIQEVEEQIDHSLERDCGKRIRDFTDIGLSWKFFVPANGPLNLNFSDRALCIRTTAPWFGVFLNRGRFGPPCLGIEPTTHATDYVAEADLLIPDEIKRFFWSLEYKSHA